MQNEGIEVCTAVCGIAVAEGIGTQMYMYVQSGVDATKHVMSL